MRPHDVSPMYQSTRQWCEDDNDMNQTTRCEFDFQQAIDIVYAAYDLVNVHKDDSDHNGVHKEMIDPDDDEEDEEEAACHLCFDRGCNDCLMLSY